MVDERKLILAVEGTAAMGPLWDTMVADYLETIIRSFHSFYEIIVSLFFLHLLCLLFHFKFAVYVPCLLHVYGFCFFVKCQN